MRSQHNNPNAADRRKPLVLSLRAICRRWSGTLCCSGCWLGQ